MLRSSSCEVVARPRSGALSGLAAGTPRQLVDRYRLDYELGRGGCGRVYEAFDLDLKRRVAIKISSDDVESERPSELGNRELLLAEGRVLRLLVDSRVIAVLDTGDDGKRSFVVMELAAGGPLSRRLKAGAAGDPWTTAAVGAALAGGLAVTHRHGFVHRDISPSNLLLLGPESSRQRTPSVLLRPGERLVLGDFGIATAADDRPASPWRLMGTRLYRAPEQETRGAPVGFAADMYAATAVIVSIVGRGLPPAIPELPDLLALLRPRWRKFVETGMNQDPSRRYSSMQRWYQVLIDAINHDLKLAGHDAIT